MHVRVVESLVLVLLLNQTCNHSNNCMPTPKICYKTLYNIFSGKIFALGLSTTVADCSDLRSNRVIIKHLHSGKVHNDEYIYTDMFRPYLNGICSLSIVGK